MGVPKDYTGQVFGRLTAVELTPERRGHDAIWVFKCECGNTCKRVLADVKASAKKGRVPSCGCLYHEHRVKAGTRHNKWQHPLYHIWVGLKQRCRDKNLRNYHNYGGRGIKVCERWAKSFQNFLDDMEADWKPGLSIDRIDVNGDYSPENCRWATNKQQCRNKRSNHIVMGMTVTELAEKSGIDRGTLYARIRSGIPEELLTTPVGKLPKRSKENDQ